MIYAAAVIGLLVGMALVLSRAVLGPDVWNRILAANSFGTFTVLLIVLLGYAVGRPEWEDIALVYALMNFVSTLAVLKLIGAGRLSAPLGTPAVPTPTTETSASCNRSMG